MYVSDPTVWHSFYENMIEGKFNPGQYRGRQRGGGGIAEMYAKKPYMIPVNPHATQEPEEKVIVGKQVSPVTAVEERAKSDLKVGWLVLLLYVPSQQLWSLRDGQFT